MSGVGIKAVHNAIDKRIVDAAQAARDAGGKRARRALTATGLLQLKLWHEIGGALSHERRERLFDAIRRQPEAGKLKADDLLIIDVGAARKQIAARTRNLEAAEAMVERNKAVMSGESVFKGTRIPVRLIATMLTDGADADEILAGCPKLDRRHLALSRIWAAAYPRLGRPKSLGERGFARSRRRARPCQAIRNRPARRLPGAIPDRRMPPCLTGGCHRDEGTGSAACELARFERRRSTGT